jgi:hypothetical protein
MDVEELVKKHFNYMRENASVSTVTMTVHRPDWERKSTIKVWTRGEEDSLFTILSPAKDKGNGTLKLGRDMWMYNPKVNKVIKLPPSMMSQAWMGSDFSNNDLAKSDTIIKDYDYEIMGTDIRDGINIFSVKFIPKPDAPVIWGMMTLEIREDLIPLEQIFYDEEMEPVKILTFSRIEMLGGKLFPRIMKMKRADTETEYTLVEYENLEFKVHLKKRLISLAALKNPGR